MSGSLLKIIGLHYGPTGVSLWINPDLLGPIGALFTLFAACFSLALIIRAANPRR